MKAKEAVRKPPATIAAGASIAEAARQMNQRAVGALVVLEEERPVGIVTDRDLVVRGLARSLPADARVDMVMTTELVTLPADADLRQAISLFYRHPFRRLPLVEDGRMVGLLSVDDLVLDLVNDLDSLVRPVFGQVIFGGPEPEGTVLPYPQERAANGERQEVGP
jgi:CBS domain-containing protein